MGSHFLQPGYCSKLPYNKYFDILFHFKRKSIELSRFVLIALQSSDLNRDWQPIGDLLYPVATLNTIIVSCIIPLVLKYTLLVFWTVGELDQQVIYGQHCHSTG